jgi:hypothetical protein
MKLHALINEDDPICLYCQGRCDVSQKASGYPDLVTYTYSCQKCQEVFESNTIDGKYFAFSFTCKNFKVFQNYGANNFGLDKKGPDLDFTYKYVWIPYFDINFSQKEELYHKIKTYILFA